MSALRLAALLTCHNRRELTLACLRRYFDEAARAVTAAQAFVVDAGSTDGTAEAIETHWPQVNLIRRDASLFWCGGMREAFARAMEEDFDAYLWLNDDTTLQAGALDGMLRCARWLEATRGRGVIVVGSILDPRTGRRSYGGVVRRGGARSLGFAPVYSQQAPVRCDTFNGNCVWVSREAARRVGNLSESFTHAIGDTDYGLRAGRLGVECWVAPGYVGLCAHNDNNEQCFSPALPLRRRWRILHSPKGLPPREWRTFARRHAGWRWPIYWLGLYLRVLLPGIWPGLRKIKARVRRWANAPSPAPALAREGPER